MFGFLRPSPTLTNAEVRSSLRMMVLEGITSEALATIQVMGFLAAYALALGANNLQVGIVSAVPFAALVVQLPAILLIERFRVRKAIGLPAWVIAQLFMIPHRCSALLRRRPRACGCDNTDCIVGHPRDICPALDNVMDELDA